MEIKLDLNASKVRPAAAPAPAERASKVAEVEVEFREAAALEKALKAAPDVRPEVVENARRLVENANYPPRETIQKLSTLLAIKFGAES